MLSVSAPQRNAAPLAPPALPRRARAPVVTSPVAPRATLSTMEQLQHSRSRSPPLAQLPVGRFNPRLSTDTHFDASSAFFVLSDTTQPFPSAVSSTPTTFSFACATSTRSTQQRLSCVHSEAPRQSALAEPPTPGLQRAGLVAHQAGVLVRMKLHQIVRLGGELCTAVATTAPRVQ